MRSSSLAFLRPPELVGLDGELEGDESSRSSSSWSSSWSSWSVIFRFLLLDVESAEGISETSFLTGVSEDGTTTGQASDAVVVLVMMGDDDDERLRDQSNKKREDTEAATDSNTQLRGGDEMVRWQ